MAGALTAASAPPSPRELAVALKTITDYLQAFGLMTARNTEIVIGSYKRALETVPRELLPAVTEGATIGLRYSRLPLPADLIAPVQPQLATRNLARLKISLIRMKTGWRPAP